MQKRIQQLQPAPALGAVILGDDGKTPAYMTQPDAEKYCNKHGMSLPTAYELAVALNPKGVSKTAKNGFHPIHELDGSVDFYYNASTYPGPSKDEDTNLFWSSSISPFGDAFFYAYAFSGQGGYFHSYYRAYSDVIAVRCVARRR